MNNSARTSLPTLHKLIDLILFNAQKKCSEFCQKKIKNKTIIISYLLILCFASISFTINSFYFHYIGNNYFPEKSVYVGLTLMLILAGIYLQYNQNNISFLIVREIFFFYLIISAIVLITNAVQYTPFKPIDTLIIHIESSVGIDMAQIISWTAHQPLLKKLLMTAYASLEYQMAFLPLLMIFIGDLQKIRTYYFLLLSSALIGFCIYYFFPTTAPASNLYSPFFLEEQYLTGQKFNEIHNHLTPTTFAGGMIAFPSFHMIWAWFCLYLTYEHQYLFILLLPINCLLIASCVLLGWHYPLDLLGAAIIIGTAHWLQYKFKN